MNFPKLKIPETIEDVTLDWLQQVFSPHKIPVVSFSLVGDARDGRGYLSSLNRVNLQIERPTSPAIPELLSVIIKTVPTDPQVRAYALRVGYFANEFQMYTKVLPTINSFLDDRGVASESRFRSPVCYYGAEEEGPTPDDYKCVLVLEDFTASGYHVPEEGGKKSFDMAETKTALREVALLHASSAAYRKCKGLQFFRDEFTKLITHNLNEPALDNYIKTGFEITRKVLMEPGDPLPEGLLGRFDTLQEEFKPIASKAFISVDPANVNVIRHSDLWFNNVAFLRDDSGNAIHAKWFDFQNCNEGALMLDVAFFLLLNCEPELSSVRLDEVLSYYHTIFTGILREAKIDVDYSWEQMKLEFSQYRLPALLHIISGAPVWCCGPRTNEVSAERLRKAILYAYAIGEL